MQYFVFTIMAAVVACLVAFANRRNFKWYRERKGGKWYRVRGIYDLGRVVLVDWTRYPAHHETVLETESY